MNFSELEAINKDLSKEVSDANFLKSRQAALADLRKHLADGTVSCRVSFVSPNGYDRNPYARDMEYVAELFAKTTPDIIRAVELCRAAEERNHRNKARILQQQLAEFFGETNAA